MDHHNEISPNLAIWLAITCRPLLVAPSDLSATCHDHLSHPFSLSRRHRLQSEYPAIATAAAIASRSTQQVS